MNMPVPAESNVVIVFGAPRGMEWRGEFIIITGSETMNTQTAYDKMISKYC